MAIIGGRVWIFGDLVSTDDMYPNVAFQVPDDEAFAYMFRASRPEWHKHVRRGDLIVGGHSFGIGSARAVSERFRDIGIGAILAESMSSLFQRNCLNGGILALAVPGIKGICEEGEHISIDPTAGRVSNDRTGASLTFAALPARLQTMVEAGGMFALLRRDGYLPAV